MVACNQADHEILLVKYTVTNFIRKRICESNEQILSGMCLNLINVVSGFGALSNAIRGGAGQVVQPRPLCPTAPSATARADPPIRESPTQEPKALASLKRFVPHQRRRNGANGLTTQEVGTV